MSQKPFFGMKQHGAEQFADLAAEGRQFIVFRYGDVPAFKGEIQTRIRLGVFTIAIRQLGNEMRFVAPLGPGLAEIETNRARRSPDLTREGIPFLQWKGLAQSEYPHRKFIALLVGDKFLGRSDLHIQRLQRSDARCQSSESTDFPRRLPSDRRPLPSAF